jgi:hypothetical protein
MKRPVAVVLTAIFLGFLAALKLLAALGMAAVGFMVLRRGLPTPTPTPFSPSFLPILFFGMSLLAAAAAVWSILTLIGLLRLRAWARYSVLVIAGCMAAFGAILTLTSFAMPFLASTVAPQPGADPSAMRVIFFVSGVLYAVVTAIGVSLFIYYNLAKTRTLFLHSAPVNLDPPNTSTGRPRPTAITVISWLYMSTAPFFLIYLFLPFPAFLFGFILYGLAAHITYAVFGALTFILGYGLYRLWNWARIAFYAFFGLGLANVLVFITPRGRSQFLVYMDAFNANMYKVPGQPPPPNFALSPDFIAIEAFICLAFCAVILWLLHRHRVAFTPAPPPPPKPPQPEPLAGLTP